MQLTDAQDAPRRFTSPKAKALFGLTAAAVVVLGLCWVFRNAWGPDAASAKGPPIPIKKATKTQSNGAASNEPAEKPQIAAVVNGDPIPREVLARECLSHHGKDVLESLSNKYLISIHCQQRKIGVTQEEVNEEIARMAERFNIPTDQWLKMLKEERHISPQQYARDIIWPTIALRKLAADRLQVSEQDMQEAYETQFGPAVQARLIACATLEKAQKVYALAIKNPDDFGNLAKQYSDDSSSASAKGLIQPIRMHIGDPNIEQVAFRLAKDEVSQIIKVGNQYVVLKCEQQIPARQVGAKESAQVKKAMFEAVRDKKLRLAADEIFAELQKETQVVNVWNDEALRQKYPGVAALINNQQITIRELAEECIERHGVEVLEGTINQLLLRQALKKKNLTVTQQELDEEVARAALAMNKVKPNGQPDVEGWLQDVNKEQGISTELYMHDAVWPTVALKKLVGGTVEVTQDDLRKGFEANYGARARCRAIVFNNHRKAQEVWGMAMANKTAEYFGKLAAQYSIEAGSSVLDGEVPPIQRHGGQPLLEKEVFGDPNTGEKGIQPGEVSSIVQLADKYVILFLEGFTTPTKVDYNEVKELIYEDIHEKKLRLKMAEEFTRLQDSAAIDNFVANKMQSPKIEPGQAGPTIQRGGLVPGTKAGHATSPNPNAGPLR